MDLPFLDEAAVDTDVLPIAPPRVTRPKLHVTVRRRRALTALAAALAGTAVLGLVPGLRAAWWVTGAVAALATAYVALLARVQHLTAEREFDLIARRADWRWDDWRDALDEAPALAEAPDHQTGEAGSQDVGLGRWVLIRFVGAYALGWLLTPAIVVLEQLAGGSGANNRRRRWLARLVKVRACGRRQSVKALSLSLVASAGVVSLSGGAGAGPRVPHAFQAAATATGQYTVQPGDTLARIAARYGTTYQGLAEINHIPDPDLIFVGQVLSLRAQPAGPIATAPPAARSDPAPSRSFEACVIRTESGGNPQVMSASGHWGLFQFSKRTWVEYGGPPTRFGDASAAEQEQIFANAIAHGGASDWTRYHRC